MTKENECNVTYKNNSSKTYIHLAAGYGFCHVDCTRKQLSPFRSLPTPCPYHKHPNLPCIGLEGKAALDMAVSVEGRVHRGMESESENALLEEDKQSQTKTTLFREAEQVKTKRYRMTDH